MIERKGAKVFIKAETTEMVIRQLLDQALTKNEFDEDNLRNAHESLLSLAVTSMEEVDPLTYDDLQCIMDAVVALMRYQIPRGN